jgi:hypothetical protein
MSYMFMAIEMNSWMSFGELLASKQNRYAQTTALSSSTPSSMHFASGMEYFMKLQFPTPPSKMEWPNALSKHTLKWSDACST